VTADPYRDCIHIAAEPEIVFEYFTNAEALARWMGDRAVVDPRPGGQFTVSRSFPPGISVLEVTLTAHDGGTLVAIAHSGLPDGERHRHAAGWRHYLARLSLAATGRDLASHVTPDEIVQGAD
jgi:uncharacterized protein YndB with AHSA1/START domain